MLSEWRGAVGGGRIALLPAFIEPASFFAVPWNGREWRGGEEAEERGIGEGLGGLVT